MILFLVCLICAGINLSVGEVTTTCKIATDVKSALYILEVAFDPFETNHDVLVASLRTHLKLVFPNSESAITNADEKKLVTWASMVGMIDAGKLDAVSDKNGAKAKTFWLQTTDYLDELRIAFEEVALAQMDADSKNYLSTFFADYSDEEVLTFVCNRGSWSTDGRHVPAFVDGCYTSDVGSDLVKFSTTVTGGGRWKCMDHCRTQKTLYIIYDVNSELCQCVDTVVGTLNNNTVTTCLTKLVYRTGNGAPIMNFEDALKFAPESLGFEAISGNDIVDVKQVNLLDVDGSGDSSLHFVALMKYAIALFKVVEDVSTKALSHLLVDWKRWDFEVCGDKTAALVDHCMKQVFPEDSRRKVFPGLGNLKYQEALAFEIFPMFVEYSAAMELNTTRPESEFIDFQSEPYIKTGTPMVYPGGKWFDHILVTHRDVVEVDMSSMIRIENGRLIQLYTAVGTTFFGNYLPAKINSFPIAMDYRTAGRKTYLFIATHRDSVSSTDGKVTLKESSVTLYSAVENEIEITDFAVYGRISTAVEFEVAAFFVTDVLYVKTVWPLLVVLDSANKDLDANGRPTNTQIKVYRIQSFVQLIPIDAVIIDNFKYTKVSHVKHDGKHKLILEGNINGEYTAKYLEMSVKGKLSTQVSDLTLPDDVKTPATGGILSFFSYGRLKNNLVVPVLSDTNIHILSYDGTDLQTTALTDRDSKAIKCFEHKEMEVCVLGRKEKSDSVLNFELTRITPHSKINVLDNDVVYTAWDALKSRIENMYTAITADYTEFSNKQSNYLMHTGSVVPVGSTWNLATLTASQLTVPANGLDDSTSVTMKIIDSEGVETSHTNMRSKLNILMDTVETQAYLVANKTTEFQTKYDNDALSLSKTTLQTISNTAINKVTAHRIRSTPGETALVVDQLKASSGTVMTLKELSDKTFMQNNPQPLLGIKSFNKGLKANDLITATLSDDLDNVAPDTCLVKNLDVTIDVAQTFNSGFSATSLLVEGTASITDNKGSTIVKEDLVPHIDRTVGLPGFISFANDVSAVGLDATITDFPLEAAQVPNIALKAQANTIAGDLTVNLGSSAATGSSLLLKNTALLNNVDILDVKNNAVRTSCVGCTDCSANCASTILQVHSPVTFTGSLSATAATVTELNDIPSTDYIKKSEFANPITLTGTKTFTDINVDILQADTFDGLTPDQLFTTNSHQDITQHMTFSKATTYKSINTPASSPCVPVDGRDLCQVFKSDLAAINAQESWITSNTIDTDLKFTKLKILDGSNLLVDGTVNKMTVGDIVDKIVTDESKSFAITGTKTISSPASLADVTSGDGSNLVNIDYGSAITTIDDYVNTRTTTEMSGTKRFTNAVGIEDIFTVGETQINDLSVAHLLHCFVDKGDHTSEPIHIWHPMSFNKVSLPRITLERTSDLSTYAIVPTDPASWPQVIQFCSIPLPNGDNLDDQDPTSDAYFLPIVNAYLLQIGVTLPEDSDYKLHAMFTCVLKTDVHVATLTKDERLAKIKKLLNEQYGISMIRLNTKTGIELLALIARNPRVNDHDPSKDLALLDGNNQFCTPTANCVQDFTGGIDAVKITTNSNVGMIDGHTIHGVDITALDQQRVELDGPNSVGGVLTFSSLSLKPTDGAYDSGRLDIATGSNGFVSSSDFAGKFVRTDLTSDQTVTGAINFQGQITASNIDATTFNINGVTYDVSNIDDISHDLDQDVTITNLFFNSDITLKNKVSLTGKLSDVTLSEFHDAIAVGADIPVTVDGTTTATIKGTDRTSLDITGAKIFTNDFTVDNVVATKDEVGLYPQFTYLSCKRGDKQFGKLSGSVLSDEFSISEVQCFDKCRDAMCYGLSYKPASGPTPSHCIIYDSITSVEPFAGYHSYLYECCYQLKVTGSSNPEMYLSVDSNNVLAVSSTDKDLWCLIGENIVHKKTDKAVINLTTQLALAAVPKTLVVGDPSPAYERFSYVSQNDIDFKIQCLGASNAFLKANGDGTATFDSIGSSWTASIVGTAFTELENDVIKPRVLTVNTAQDVAGSFIVLGDLGVENVELHSDNLAALTYDTVTATYSYSTGTHQIATPYTITGSGITVTNLNSNSYNTDIADFVRLDSASEVTLQGNTQFNADITSNHANGITVGGTVASFDLADFNTNVARTYATSHTFTQPNTFAVNPNDGQTYDLEGTSLTSTVDMTLTNSQISGVNKIDLVDLRSKTILNDETSPVTINGKVIFNKVAINGGHFTMGDSRLNGNDIGIVDDLILRSDATVDFSNHAIDSMIVNQPLTITGQDLFGHNSEKFLDVLYKDGDQTVTEAFTMNGAVSAGQTITTGTFNGYEPLQSMIQLSATVNIDSKFDFKQTLNLNSVDVSGTVNGFDFLAKFRDSVATLAGDNTITQKWTIQPAHFAGDVLGTEATNNMYINDQRVSDLNKAAGIFDHMHAVKVSAQAEANVLCEFVSDLQESYLSNQEIIHYELVKTETFAGAVFSCSKMVNTPDSSKYFLFVLNGRDLELYYVHPSTGVLSKLFNKQLTIGLADGFLPRIDHVVDVSSDSSTNYRYVVFVSTGKPSSGVEMYYADINTAVNSVSISSVGALSNALAVSDFSLSSVLVYNKVTGVVGLSVINVADLVTCSGTGDCSSVTPAETLSACTADDPEICQVDSVTDAVQVALKTRLLPTGHRMVAFNQKIASLNQDVVRVLLFEKSVAGAYTLSKNIIESSSTLDFSISILDAKVFLILSGSKLEMREVHVQTGTLEDKDLSLLDGGTYTNILDGKDFGSENGILVVKNGMKFVDLKYNGVNGLKTYSTLDVPHNILSVSCTDVVDSTSGLVVYMKAFLGRDTITILKADLANPVKYVQFECVQPEVPAGFTTN